VGGFYWLDLIICDNEVQISPIRLDNAKFLCVETLQGGKNSQMPDFKGWF